MTAITGEAAVPAVNEPRRVPSPIELYEARVRTSWVRMPGLLSSKAPSVQLSSRATTTTIAIPPGISNRRRLSIHCNVEARANFFTYPGLMATSPYVIEYEGAFYLDLPPEEVWTIISRTNRFEDWWSWLRDFETEGSSLETGSVLRGVVVPPLPYRMRLEVVLEECVMPHRIAAVVSGDLEGNASLTFTPDGGGTQATVGWTIEMMQGPMRLAARLAHPLLRWGHDLVVQATVEGFRRTLAAESGPAGSSVSGSGGPAPS